MRLFTPWFAVSPMAFARTKKEISRTLTLAKEEGASIYFLPLGTLFGQNLGSLAKSAMFQRHKEELHTLLQRLSEEFSPMLIVTEPLAHGASETAPPFQFYKGGQCLHTPCSGDAYYQVQWGKGRFLAVDTANFPLERLHQLPLADVDFLLLGNSGPYLLGKAAETKRELEAFFARTQVPVWYAQGHFGGSGVPYLHNPFGLHISHGAIGLYREKKADFSKSGHHMAGDFPLATLGAEELDIRPLPLPSVDNVATPAPTFVRDPFYAHFSKKDPDFLSELFYMQAKSLALRLHNTGIQKLLLPLSGGLDSTLALLVCLGALDLLGLASSHLLAVTMPGLGTTSASYDTALGLIQKSGATGMDISIKKAVLGHFKDIGHDEHTADITYENAQARERTQIALDLANKHGALLVGTGDMSEDALGFCTFGGDHLANFNVNVCLTKTMVRQMVDFLQNEPQFAHLSYLLAQVLKAPVSPELLPTKGGQLVQKTEDFLGDYLLHDFILYYFVYANLDFVEIYKGMCQVFVPKYTKEMLKNAVLTFAKRFFTSQFKRACQPDATALTEIHLLGSGYHFPSDLQVGPFLADLADTLAQ